ncbi:MAG: 4Fe-4S dicluster domain-containing protein [Bacillota bacterium]
MGHLGHANEAIYRALLERLDKNPVIVPQNENLLEILYRIFTEKEANIASNFPMQGVPIDELAEITGIEKAELKVHLDAMAEKGLVMDYSRGGVPHYAFMQPFPGFFEFTFMRYDNKFPMAELAPLFEQFQKDMGGLKDVFGTDHKVFHIRSYADLISPEVKSEVMPYEMVSDMIRDAGGGSLSYCYCRRKAQTMGKECKVKAPIEVCTNLGKASEFMVRHNAGRPATVDELLRVLDETEKLGLMHMGDNVQNNPAFVCHCCGCCCTIMRIINDTGMQAVNPSNFIPQVDIEACSGCGKCAKRCHMHAIEIVEQTPGDKKSKMAVVNYDKCIGCGACVGGCKNEALGLTRKKELYIPPRNKAEQMILVAAAKGQ